jgi:hypothetical protein
MKKVLVLALVGFLAAGFAAVAAPAGAQEYDRYERGTAAPPPPPPPPAAYRTPAPPPPRPAGFHAGPYFFGNIGLFEPSDYYDDYYYSTYNLSGYSSGLSANAGFGSRLTPFAAIEGTVGYFAAERGSDEASVVPLTLGGRLILPHPVFEPYMGAGVGVYFASLKENYTSTYYTDDENTTIGGYFSLGMDFWLSPKIALNFEGRYQMVEPTFTDNRGLSFDLDMSGWELNFGFRVNF